MECFQSNFSGFFAASPSRTAATSTVWAAGLAPPEPAEAGAEDGWDGAALEVVPKIFDKVKIVPYVFLFLLCLMMLLWLKKMVTRFFADCLRASLRPRLRLPSRSDYPAPSWTMASGRQFVEAHRAALSGHSSLASRHRPGSSCSGQLSLTRACSRCHRGRLLRRRFTLRPAHPSRSRATLRGLRGTCVTAFRAASEFVIRQLAQVLSCRLMVSVAVEITVIRMRRDEAIVILGGVTLVHCSAAAEALHKVIYCSWHGIFLRLGFLTVEGIQIVRSTEWACKSCRVFARSIWPSLFCVADSKACKPAQ